MRTKERFWEEYGDGIVRCIILWGCFITGLAVWFMHILAPNWESEDIPALKSRIVEEGCYHIDDYNVLDEVIYETPSLFSNNGQHQIRPIIITANGEYFYTYMDMFTLPKNMPTAGTIRYGKGIIIGTQDCPEGAEAFLQWAKENNIEGSQFMNHGVVIITDRVYRGEDV